MSEESNQERFFINKSNETYFFGELGRVINTDEKKVHLFTEDDINKCPLLLRLIMEESFKEVTKEEYLIFRTALNMSSFLPKQKEERKETYFNVREPESSIAERIGTPPVPAEEIGAPTQTVSLDPKGMDAFLRNIRNPQNGSKTLVEKSAAKDNSLEMKISVDTESSELKKKSEKRLEVFWHGPAHDAGGYGKMSRECVEGLFKKDINVHLDLHKIPEMRCAVAITPSMQEMLKTEVSKTAPYVWAVMPTEYIHTQGRKIYYTMMETFGVPKTFANKCNNADELWLPSKFNMDMFGDANIDPDLYYMPLGVNTDLYKPMKLTESQKEVFNIKTKSFVFFSLFGWSLRKGVDVLFESYLKEFSGDDDVSIVVMSRKDGSASDEKNSEIRDQIKKYIERWCPHNPPHIIHIGQSVPEEHLPILYNMCDCFVLPTRGEGFGLIMAEAGSCGLPVIATRCCGQMDFLNDDNSYLIDIEGYDIGSQEVQALSSYYEKMPFAVIGQKAINQTREYMRYVMNNNSQAKEKAGLLRENIENNFTWDHLVDRVFNRLKEIQS